MDCQRGGYFDLGIFFWVLKENKSADVLRDLEAIIDWEFKLLQLLLRDHADADFTQLENSSHFPTGEFGNVFLAQLGEGEVWLRGLQIYFACSLPIHTRIFRSYNYVSDTVAPFSWTGHGKMFNENNKSKNFYHVYELSVSVFDKEAWFILRFGELLSKNNREHQYWGGMGENIKAEEKCEKKDFCCKGHLVFHFQYWVNQDSGPFFCNAIVKCQQCKMSTK